MSGMPEMLGRGEFRSIALSLKDDDDLPPAKARGSSRRRSPDSARPAVRNHQGGQNRAECSLPLQFGPIRPNNSAAYIEGKRRQAVRFS